MESNRIEQISNWFLSNFLNYFSPSNQSNHKFSNRIGRILNESSIWKIWLYPTVGVESNEFRINFHQIRIFFVLSNRKFWIESKEIRTTSNLTLPLFSGVCIFSKTLLLLKRILDLPTRGQKCNVSKLQPVIFVIFQMEHPVVAFRRLCSSLFLCFSFSLFLLKKRRIHKRSLRSLRKAIVTIDCFWLKLPQL